MSQTKTRTRPSETNETATGVAATTEVPSIDELLAQADREAHPTVPTFEEPSFWWPTEKLILFDCHKAGGYGKKHCEKEEKRWGEGHWLHGYDGEDKLRDIRQVNRIRFLAIAALGLFVSYLLTAWLSHTSWSLSVFLSLAGCAAGFTLWTIYHRLENAAWARAVWRGHAKDREKRVEDARAAIEQAKLAPATFRNQRAFHLLQARIAAARERRIGEASEFAKTRAELTRQIAAASGTIAELALHARVTKPMAAVMDDARATLEAHLKDAAERRDALDKLIAAATAGYKFFEEKMDGASEALVCHGLVEKAMHQAGQLQQFVRRADEVFYKTLAGVQTDFAAFNQKVFETSAAAAGRALDADDAGFAGAMKTFKESIDQTVETFRHPPALPEGA